MAAGTPSTDARSPRRRAGIIAVGCVYLVVAGAVVHGVQLFVQNPMSAAMLAAVAVTFVAGRARLETEPGGAPARRRALIGAGLALAVVALSVAVTLAAGAQLDAAMPTLSLLFATGEAVAVAFTLEVWLHGIPLTFAKRAGLPPSLAIAYAVAAGVAAVALDGELQTAGLVLTVASGTLFAGLWQRTGDAWASVAAHFVWVWMADVVLAGEVIHLGSGAGLLTDAPNARGAVAWAAAVGFAALALLLLKLGWPRLSRAQLPSDERDAAEPKTHDEIPKTGHKARKRQRPPDETR